MDEQIEQEYNNVIFHNIIKQMTKKCLTLRQLAQKSGVPKTTLYAMCKPYSTANPTKSTIAKLETFFGLAKGELLKEQQTKQTK
jgi:transcriptional regulator with XRE-family HTH domain